MKPLYLGHSIADLRKLITIPDDFKEKAKTPKGCQAISKSAENVFDQGVAAKLDDQERALILFLRAMELMALCQKSLTPEDKRLFERILKEAESLKIALKARYEQAAADLARKEQEAAAALAAQVVAVRKAEEDAAAAALVLQRKQAETEETRAYETLFDRKPINDAQVRVDAEALYALLSRNVSKLVLLVDVRSRTAFQHCHIKFSELVHVPEEFLKPGITSSECENLLRPDAAAQKLKSRDAYEYIILMDNDSAADVLHAGDNSLPIVVMHDCIAKWCSTKPLRNPPRVLDGGFHAWSLLYPSLCVTAAPTSSVATLSDKSLNYPEIDAATVRNLTALPAAVAPTNAFIPDEDVDDDQALLDSLVADTSSSDSVPRSDHSAVKLTRTEKSARRKSVTWGPDVDLEAAFVACSSSDDSASSHAPALSPPSIPPASSTTLLPSLNKQAESSSPVMVIVNNSMLSNASQPKMNQHEDNGNFEFTSVPVFPPVRPSKPSELGKQVASPASNGDRTISPLRPLPIPTEDSTSQLAINRATKPLSSDTFSGINLQSSENRAPSVNRTSKPLLSTSMGPTTSVIVPHRPTLHRQMSVGDLMSVEQPALPLQQQLQRGHGTRPMLSMDADRPRFNTLGVVGLKNLGNTCFINSILQCLSAAIPLSIYFKKNFFAHDINRTSRMGTKGELVTAFGNLLRVMWGDQCRVASPADLKATISKWAPRFAGYEQQDSQEFLLYLLDGLHEDLNKAGSQRSNPNIGTAEDDRRRAALPIHMQAEEAWKDHMALNQSIIVDCFQGQFLSTVTCATCGFESVSFNPFVCLTLPLPSSGHVSMAQCIRQFTKEEVIGDAGDQWICSRCKVARRGRKKLEIWKLPRILIICFKRFYYNGPWREKIQTGVDFPLSGLDMNQYCLQHSSRPTAKPYQLFAVSNHIGTMDGGHYTAFACNPVHDTWYHFDDALCSPVDASQVQTRAAYVLFYENFGFHDYVNKLFEMK